MVELVRSRADRWRTRCGSSCHKLVVLSTLAYSRPCGVPRVRTSAVRAHTTHLDRRGLPTHAGYEEVACRFDFNLDLQNAFGCVRNKTKARLTSASDVP